MSTALRFPPDFQTDTEFVEVALAEFRQQWGFGDNINFGDLDAQSRRDILAHAQLLKKKQREGLPR